MQGVGYLTLAEMDMTDDNRGGVTNLPYSRFAQVLRPYRMLLFGLAIAGFAVSVVLIGPGTNDNWKGIPALVGFLFWGFFLISYWFDPRDGRFTRRVHPLVRAVFNLNPSFFAFGVTLFITVCIGMLIYIIGFG